MGRTPTSILHRTAGAGNGQKSELVKVILLASLLLEENVVHTY